MAGTTSYYHCDASGNVRALTDSSQNVTDRYTYDAFGNTVAQSGTTENKFRFGGRVGYHLNPDSGSYYVRQREYQPAIIRWLSLDPIRFEDDPLDLYRHVENNPVIYVDPSGHIEIEDDPRLKWNRPGLFRVKLSKCGATAEGDKGCCCTDVRVTYYPSNRDKSKYLKICLKVRVKTYNELKWLPDWDSGWHDDHALDDQTCWSRKRGKYTSPKYAEWTDFPGGGSDKGITCPLTGCPGLGDVLSIQQWWEVCAIGALPSGEKRLIGCVTYEHHCQFSFRRLAATGSCKCPCEIDCTIDRRGSEDVIEPDLPKHGPWNTK